MNLRPTDLQWTALERPLARVHPPAAISAEDTSALSQMPVHKEFVVECLSEVSPHIPFWDDAAQRPCFARVALIAERGSGLIVDFQMKNGEAPIGDVVAPALVKALRTMKARPGEIHVEDERLVGVLGAACAAIDVPLLLVKKLAVAPSALRELTASLPAPH
jgi:hypothetical protein